VTHVHPDHFGLAGKIAELANARVMLGAVEKGLIDSRYNHPDELIKQMSDFLKANGVPDWELKMLSEASLNIRGNIAASKAIGELNPGDKISMDPFEFQVLLTPGHSPGHICLYEPNKKYLFSGDHVLAETVPNVSYHPQSGENPLGDYVKSLQGMADLEVRFVFPGHGSVFSGLAPKIDDIMHMHRDRMRAIQTAMGVEMKSGYDVAKNIPWIVNGETVQYDKLEPIDRRLAVLETLAHLQFLVSEGQGKKMSEGEKTVYFSGE
jgi:glyoxylase-like metal-dependent hydrolase (beta-lactamase superfamily II)